jgi:hypothetical protein
MGYANPSEVGFKVTDSVDIEGRPDLHFDIECASRLAAAVIIANCLRRAVGSETGLMTK